MESPHGESQVRGPVPQWRVSNLYQAPILLGFVSTAHELGVSQSSSMSCSGESHFLKYPTLGTSASCGSCLCQPIGYHLSLLQSVVQGEAESSRQSANSVLVCRDKASLYVLEDYNSVA